MHFLVTTLWIMWRYPVRIMTIIEDPGPIITIEGYFENPGPNIIIEGYGQDLLAAGIPDSSVDAVVMTLIPIL